MRTNSSIQECTRPACFEKKGQGALALAPGEMVATKPLAGLQELDGDMCVEHGSDWETTHGMCFDSDVVVDIDLNMNAWLLGCRGPLLRSGSFRAWWRLRCSCA